MIDKSIYEAGHPMREATDGKFCFGYITAVDIAKRLCSVKTFYSSDPLLSDQSIKSAQWLSMDASAYGDDFTSVPRVGSNAFVFFVQGEAFVWGYLRGIDQAGSAAVGTSSVTLSQGDKIIATKGGNYLAVKSNGLIQIQCSDTLRSLFLPNNSEWLNLCQNFELKADGGYIFWRSDDNDNCLWKAAHRTDIQQEILVIEEKGYIDGTAVYKVGIGPGVANGTANSYQHQVNSDGTSLTTVGALGIPAVTVQLNPDGSANVSATGNVAVTSTMGDISAVASTGNINVESGSGNISVTADSGAVSVTASAGNVSVTATAGTLALEGSGGQLKLAQGKVGIGGPTAELVDVLSQTIDLITKVGNTILQMTMLGNLGYSTSPPINSADFAMIVENATQLQVMLTTIKGGL